MRSLFRKHKDIDQHSRVYLMIRFWWVVKMDRITKNLSKSQLWLSLAVFMMIGTVLCFYKIISGVLLDSPESISIERISVVKPFYSDKNETLHFLNISLKKSEKQSDLGRYIDSVINVSCTIDLDKKYNSNGAGF